MNGIFFRKCTLAHFIIACSLRAYECCASLAQSQKPFRDRRNLSRKTLVTAVYTTLTRHITMYRVAQKFTIQSNSSMRHLECVAQYKDINLQRGLFWASSLASCSSRSREERSPWMVFIQVVRGHPDQRLQVSGEAQNDLAGACILIHSHKMPKMPKCLHPKAHSRLSIAIGFL